LRTKGYAGALYKSFDNQEDAVQAWRNGYEEEARSVLRAIANAPHRKEEVDYTQIPEIIPGSWAVDAACSKNPGAMEYRGVDVYTGAQIFHQGPFQEGTNNIGEFLAIVHALAMLYNRGDGTTAIYSDSRTAQIWVRKRKCGTKLERTEKNARLLDIVARAEQWLQTHSTTNPIYKWQTDKWGEIPADFGRK
jgi:ribonuclease HI